MRLSLPEIHPAHRLCCWLLVVIAIQCFSIVPLIVSLVALPLLGRGVFLRWLRLLRRARWLLLTLLVVLAWGVAGEAVWEQGGALAPTFEGLTQAASQLGRLVLVLAAVAALLETTPMVHLMAGLHVLLRPFGLCGLDIDRAVVRLSLALHYAEQMPVADWKRLLAPSATTGPKTILLTLPAPHWYDWAVLLVVAIFPIGVCLA